jgi:hypothetical protein
METMNKENKGASIQEKNKKRRSWGARFMNFLAMGGFIIILILAAAIFIFISYLTGK